jgi:antitoxin ParD1/3/4
MSEFVKFRYAWKSGECIMNVSLTPELEKLIQKKVDSGRYTSASEVVREALRLLEQKDRQDAERQRALRVFQEELDWRIAELDRGEGIDAEEASARLRAHAQERRKKTA